MYYDERDNVKIKYNNELEEKNNINNKEILDYDNMELNTYETNKTNKFENNYTQNDSKKWNNNFTFDINNININNFRKKGKPELFGTSEGQNKGTIFKNEYDPYKNYIYRVVVKGEKDKLLLKIQELTFKTIDLNIYLDINPDDMEIYNEFKNTIAELKRQKELYEKNYGPLCMTDTLFYDDYKWSMDPWPWMNEGGRS